MRGSSSSCLIKTHIHEATGSGPAQMFGGQCRWQGAGGAPTTPALVGWAGCGLTTGPGPRSTGCSEAACPSPGRFSDLVGRWTTLSKAFLSVSGLRMLSQLPVAATTKGHKLWGLENTTALCALTVLEAGRQKSRYHRAQLPPGDSQGGSFLPLSASGGSGLWRHLMAASVSIDPL